MSYHVRVKICGVTTEVDARQAALLGADAIGLNFHDGSPRRVGPMRSNPSCKRFRPSSPRWASSSIRPCVRFSSSFMA